MTKSVAPLLSQFNKAFENRLRFAIMYALSLHASLDFNGLKALVGGTDGNLASHLKRLEQSGFIGVRKGFVGRIPNTQYSATKIGLRAFRKHLDVITDVMNHLRQ